MDEKKLYEMAIVDGVLSDIEFFEHSCPIITIPEGVKSINKQALDIPFCLSDPSKCKTDSLLSVKEISLPSSLESVESFEAFTGLESLSKIIVNENNPNFKTYNDYVISNDEKTLIFVPPNSGEEEFIFNDSIERIKKYALCGNMRIKKLSVPERIIGPYYFMDMKALEYVYLPDNVISIPKEGFRGCEKLKEVFASDNLIRVEDYAFAYIPVIPKLPSSIKRLGDAAFAVSAYDTPDKAKTIIIPPNVTSLGLGVCSGREDIIVYDNITPNTKGKVDINNGLPNSNVGWIGIHANLGYTLCAGEWNSDWKAHSITVKDSMTDEIKYKVWMNREGNPRSYYCRLASSWGDNASFDFLNVDKEFKSIKYLEDKSRYALYRLQYPYELTDERKSAFEKYLKKNRIDIIKMCLEIANATLLKEFAEFIDISSIEKKDLDNLMKGAKTKALKECLGTLLNN